MLCPAIRFRSNDSDPRDKLTMDDLSYLRAGEACHAGKFLSKKQVELLEQSLQTEPENLNDRLKLIGFYYKSVQWDSSSRKAALRHISWLVANEPDHIALRLPETTTAFVSDSSLDEELSSQWETMISLSKNDNDFKERSGVVTFPAQS